MGILNRSMKPAAKQSAAISANSSSIDLPVEMRAAMNAATASLDARKAVDGAIARNNAEQAEAEVECEQASGVLTDIDIAGALETDPGKIKQLEPKIEFARRRQEDATQRMARIGRLKVALAEKAREADDRIRADRTLFQIEAQAYGQQLLAALGAELREAAKPLLGVLLRLHAATYGLGAGRAMVGLLEEVKLPSAIWGEQPIITGSRDVDERGESVDMAAAWRAAPEASVLAEVMQPYNDLRHRLAAHQDYRPPAPGSERPYKIKASLPTDRKRWADEETIRSDREAAAEAARPRAQPKTWTGTPGSVG